MNTASATATAGADDEREPPVHGRQQAADQRARARARPVCTLANVPIARVSRCERHDLGERGEQERRQERVRGALHEARGHEDRQRRRGRRDQRADGVGDEARAHDARHAEALADRARDELQGGERDQVRGDRRRHRVARGVEARLQLGHEHAEDGAAEGSHEPPDVERDRGVAGAHGPPTIRGAAMPGRSPAADRLPRPAVLATLPNGRTGAGSPLRVHGPHLRPSLLYVANDL